MRISDWSSDVCSSDLELGNYRKIALLGLPEAQQATPLLTALEQRLTAITSRVAQKDADADQVLEQLSALSAELAGIRSEEHTSELQSLMRISYAVFCLKQTIYISNTYYCNIRY